MGKETSLSEKIHVEWEGGFFLTKDVSAVVLDLLDWFDNDKGTWLGKHIKMKIRDRFGDKLT